jgi:hypothetical protein
LLGLLGDTVEIRKREIEAIDDSNRYLQLHIWAVQDANAAYQQAQQEVQNATAALQSAIAIEISRIENEINDKLTVALQSLSDSFESLTKDINSQIEALRSQRQIAQESLSNIRSVFDVLKNNIRDILQLMTPMQTATQGMAFVKNALSVARATGYLPDPKELADAISAARSGLEPQMFATALEQKIANIRFANELIELQKIASEQEVAAEEQVNYAEEQIELLRLRLEQARQQYEDNIESTRVFYDAQLTLQKQQLQALLGNNTATLSVQQAVIALSVAMDNLAASQATASQAAQAASQATATQAGAQAQTATQAPQFSPFEQSIANIYKKLLNRQAGISELQAWASSGLSLENIELSIMGLTEYRQLQIEKFYREILKREADAAGLAYWLSSGLSLNEIKNAIQQSTEAQNLPKFSSGGLHEGGMRIVGERGPELEVTGPARYMSNANLSSMLNSGASEEIRSLREENKVQMRALVSLQSRMTRLLERWDGDGLPEERAVA